MENIKTLVKEIIEATFDENTVFSPEELEIEYTAQIVEGEASSLAQYLITMNREDLALRVADIISGNSLSFNECRCLDCGTVYNYHEHDNCPNCHSGYIEE